jgi:hypothetical protein
MGMFKKVALAYLSKAYTTQEFQGLIELPLMYFLRTQFPSPRTLVGVYITVPQ